MKMTMLQHFAELRRRMLWAVCIFFVMFCVGWCVSDYLEIFLTKPLLDIWEDARLLYTDLSDGLIIKFSLSILIALMFSIPFFMWHIWAYLAPGLHKNEKRFFLPIFIISPLLFVAGGCFAFFVLFPFVFKFFIEVNQSVDIPAVLLPSMNGYLNFSIKLIKTFGVAFQLPLIMVILNKLDILSKSQAIFLRRYFIVGIFIIAAVLTPPDIISQILLALPMCLLFEISILFMKQDS